MTNSPRWLVLVLAIAGLLLNLPGLLFGLRLLSSWARLHLSGGLYFEYDYFRNGFFWFFLATACAAFSLVTIWKRGTHALFSVISAIVGFLCVMYLPNVGPEWELHSAATKILGHADHSLSDWDDSHGRFPSDESELREALAARPLQERAIFYHNGEEIPYDVRIIANALSAMLEPLPTAPGTLVYAVSTDKKEYWLVLTTLRNPVGGPVVIHATDGDSARGPALVMNRKHHNPGEGYQPFIE